MPRNIEIHDGAGILQKFRHLDWVLVLLITAVASTGFAALYSAAGGHFDPWASRQMTRFSVGVIGMLIVAVIDIRIWHRFAYTFYAVVFVLLIAVEIMGHIGMGAQRWINLGFVQIQPSELMKIALVMALARYFHAGTMDSARRFGFLIPAALMILAPVGLVMFQPDLGTALLIGMTGTAVVFLGGAPLRLFIGGIAAVIAIIPIGWHFMHDYQKQRVHTFLDPESDPLGSGYHITQSKIALGSGGINGKGFLHGTQSHLNFLPEKQTDFIFTLWAEEWGLLGGLFLLLRIREFATPGRQNFDATKRNRLIDSIADDSNRCFARLGRANRRNAVSALNNTVVFKNLLGGFIEMFGEDAEVRHHEN